jgi:adenosylcobyric acid synthase
MTARCIMVLGTSSGAGKSWIATALCRHYANLGLRVAPFKAQNMSNNARVVQGLAADDSLVQSLSKRVPEMAADFDGLSPNGEEHETVARGGNDPAAGPFPRPGAAPSGGSATGEAVERGGHILGEIGSAQYFQALAAKAEPDVRMNPLLLKPEADTRSQVVLLGQVSRALSDMPWRGRSEHVWPQIAAALDSLRAENDVVVIEGAGSPAEINLMASDVVNLRVARHAQAACLLVADIDRGGAFAHLYGTWALLPEADRARLRGFVLNKFRGDAALLAPGPAQLQQLTGVPTVAVVPMVFAHGLPEEDGWFDQHAPASSHASEFQAKSASGASATSASSYQQGSNQTVAPLRHIAIVAYPRISNLDEFQPLRHLPGVRLTWARTPADVAGADCIILPGSKATAADLAWLRAQRLDAAIAEHAAQGGRVLGICGGLQMLGEALIDLHGVESFDMHANSPGLGLLPLVTSMEPDKTVCRTHTTFGTLQGAWGQLSGVVVSGYEIHCGQTAQHPAMAAKGDVACEVIPGLAWQNPTGNVLGLYLHGLFEDPAALHALFGAQAPTLDAAFDRLAEVLAQSFEPGVLDGLIAP